MSDEHSSGSIYQLPTSDQALAMFQAQEEEYQSLVLGDVWSNLSNWEKFNTFATLTGAALNNGSAGMSIRTTEFPKTGVIIVDEATAGSAWSDFSGGISDAGAATQLSTYVAPTALIQAEGNFGLTAPVYPGMVLSLSPQQAIAAALPTMGLSVDSAEFYTDSDSTFFQTLKDAIRPFFYKDTEVVPGVIDSNGLLHLDGRLMQALSDAIEAAHIGGDASHIDTSGVSKTGLQFPTYIPDLNVFTSFAGQEGDLASWTVTVSTTHNYYLALMETPTSGIYELCAYADGPGTAIVSGSYNYNRSLKAITRNGITYYGCVVASYRLSSPSYTFTPSVTSSYGLDGSYERLSWDIPYYIFNGVIESSGYPKGVSKWAGDLVDWKTNGKRVVVDPDSEEYPVFYPALMPIGDPGVSTSPLEYPNPQSPVEFPEIVPYLNPQVAPQEYPLPSTETLPDLAERTAPIPFPIQDETTITDPEADAQVQPSDYPPNPEVPDTPQSGGESPSPTFPIDPAEWPSIVPDYSTPGGGASGLIHVYNPSTSQMIAFGRWLWVTYADATIDKIWNNPFDGVISAHELYATPSNGATQNIRSGFLVSDASAPTVPVRYSTINCGSIVVPEYYGNYLDYSPYTKAHIYLPFIGIVELDSDDIIGHAVNVTYKIDSYNGSCIAQITVARDDYNNTMYQFSGNCAVEIPLAGGSQAAIKAGMISAAAYGLSSVIGGISSAVGGNIAGGISQVAGGLGSAVSAAVSQKSSVQHSGSFGSSFGAMGIKKPFIIIRRPIQKIVPNYNKEYGFPAHKQVIIGNCTGYLRVRECNITSATATDEEKAKIEELLKGGVYVS